MRESGNASTSNKTGLPASAENSSGQPNAEVLYGLLAENAREMVSRHGPDLTFIYASPASSRVIGRNPDELIGQRLDDLVHPDDLSSLVSAFALAREEDDATSSVFRIQNPDDSWRWCEVYCRRPTQDEEDFLEVHATIRDISKYKRIEKAIERVAREWRVTFDSAQDAIIMLDKHSRIVRVNLAAKNLFDCQFSDLLGRRITEASLEFLNHKDPFSVARLFREKSPIRHEAKLDGDTQWVRSTIDPVLDQSGNLNGAVLFVSDISTEKMREFQLESTLEKLRQLSSHLQTVREEERKAIAREVHDDLGHSLAILKMDVSWLVKRIPQPDDAVNQRAAEAIKQIDAAVSAVRRISSELRPPILDDLGLDAALEWLVRDFQKRSGIEASLELPEQPVRIRGEVASTLFRVVQETLTNILKHSQATALKVRWQESGDRIRFEINDNGKGFDPERADRVSGFGLLGISERVRNLGGALEVSSSSGHGTSIRFSIPHDAIDESGNDQDSDRR